MYIFRCICLSVYVYTHTHVYTHNSLIYVEIISMTYCVSKLTQKFQVVKPYNVLIKEFHNKSDILLDHFLFSCP